MRNATAAGMLARARAGGAYSYPKPGQYTGFNGSRGQRRGNVHFVGKHTSVNVQGCMEGALRSGYRCAREVLRG